MKKTLFRNFTLIIVVALMICSLITSSIFSRIMFNHDVKHMISSLQLIDYVVDYNGDIKEQLAQIKDVAIDGYKRITIIDADGYVVADTALDLIEDNHKNRSEVEQALINGVGSDVRYSNTLNEKMLYVAYVSSSGYILRISVQYSGLQEYLVALVPSIAVSILLSTGLAILLAKMMSDKIIQPLEEISSQLLEIETNKPVFKRRDYAYEELNNIAMVTETLSAKVNSSIASLKKEKNKLHYILDNMQEGLIVLDQNNVVILKNNAANIIFNCDYLDIGLGVERYIKHPKILKKITSEKLIEKFELLENYYTIYKAKLESGVFKDSTIILILDTTAEEKAMKMKQDFFSSASHELKTPLTSIQGYTELLSQNLITDETLKLDFINRILKETKNMTKLIQEILVISKLETNQHQPMMNDIQMKLVVEDIFHTLSPLANDKSINMIHYDEDVIFYAELEQMNQLISNLLSNAIKYGKIGGWVSIHFSSMGEGLKIIVEDNGIGIPEEDIPHLTERFYRVNKGRSKVVEGTGLGLSIVKHIVQIYDGQLLIDSEVEIGTKIVVYLKNMKKDV